MNSIHYMLHYFENISSIVIIRKDKRDRPTLTIKKYDHDNDVTS